MQILQCRENFCCIKYYTWFFKSLFALQMVKKLATVDKLHDKVEFVLSLQKNKNKKKKKKKSKKRIK